MGTKVGDPDWPPVSRTQLYAERQAREIEESRSTELEAELEVEKIRNLRLSSRLIEEVELRARAERLADNRLAEVENLTGKVTELEKGNGSKGRKKRTGQSGERVGDGGEVSGGVQRVDGSTAPKRTRRPKPADSSSDVSKYGPPASRNSSRTRGKVT